MERTSDSKKKTGFAVSILSHPVGSFVGLESHFHHPGLSLTVGNNARLFLGLLTRHEKYPAIFAHKLELFLFIPVINSTLTICLKNG